MTSVGTGLEGVGILFEWSAFEVLLYNHNIHYEPTKDEIVQTLWFSTVKYTTFLGPNRKVFFSYSSFKRTLLVQSAKTKVYPRIYLKAEQRISFKCWPKKLKWYYVNAKIYSSGTISGK